MSALGYRLKNGVGSRSHATSMSEMRTEMPSTLVKSRMSLILSLPILWKFCDPHPKSFLTASFSMPLLPMCHVATPISVMYRYNSSSIAPTMKFVRPSDLSRIVQNLAKSL